MLSAAGALCAAATSTSGNGQRRPQVDQSRRIVLTLPQRHAGFDITLSRGRVEENAHRAADLYANRASPVIADHRLIWLI
jgi:hypothetical protein